MKNLENLEAKDLLALIDQIQTLKNTSPKFRPSAIEKPNLPNNDHEKRKLAEQRATKRLKADPEKKKLKVRLDLKEEN